MKKTFLILLFFITSCGYQPIYLNKNIKNFQFSKINSEGEKNINRKIINSLPFKESATDKSLNELVLKSSYNIEETSKNSKGQVKSYRSTINVNLLIVKDKKILRKKNFLKDFTYSSSSNKFDLVEYQDEIKNNIVDKIIEEIILYMSL